METCLYHGTTICSYDLKDSSGIYIEELIDTYKQAASNRELRCPDCNEPVYLAAGAIKEPYFAHFDDKKCPYAGTSESETSKLGKRLLYQMLKKSYPEHEVSARHRLENGTYCTAYADINGGLALDFHFVNLSFKNFEERNAYYEAINLQRIYVLGAQGAFQKQYLWYLGQIQKAQGYCVLFQIKKQELVIYKRIRYHNKRHMINFEDYLYKDKLENFFFNEYGKLSLFHKDNSMTVEEMVRLHEQILYSNSEITSDEINAAALENAIKQIKAGNVEFVSEKYRKYIYEKHPEWFHQ